MNAAAAMSNRPRRLSAILQADLSGYVRLMEVAEERTIDRLKSAHTEVWQPAIESGGGRIVNVVGDSVLAEFSSAVAAVVSAVNIQECMARFNERLDEDQRLMFRIGLHLGEVIVDDSDTIYGDGVSVAARIQLLAEPGGIAASRTLRDVTYQHIDHAFVDGGEHQAKNISRALQVYHLQTRERAMRTTTPIVPQATLRLRGSDRDGRKYSFDVRLDELMAHREGLLIGRDFDQCRLVLSHATVSRRHARLVFAGGVLQVEDLGSTNGTSVDGAEAHPGQPQSLQAGVTLKVGDIELSVERS